MRLHGAAIRFDDGRIGTLYAGYANEEHRLEVKIDLGSSDWPKPVHAVSFCLDNGGISRSGPMDICLGDNMPGHPRRSTNKGLTLTPWRGKSRPRNPADNIRVERSFCALVERLAVLRFISTPPVRAI